MRRKLAAATGLALLLNVLPVAPSWGQQAALRAQTDEVQRAIAEALRQANSDRRRNAARTVPERPALRSPETPQPQSRHPSAWDVRP